MLDQPATPQPQADKPDTLLGTVFKKTLGHSHVSDQLIGCELSNRLRKILIYPITDVSSLRPRAVCVADIRAVDPLVIGGSLVDTPGMRKLGLWNIGDCELAEYFPEFRQFAGLCRFGASCSHNHEPDCAIKALVEDDQISARRHQSYLRLKG